MNGKHIKAKKPLEFSKRLICDIRWLLWIVTIGGFLLAFYVVRAGYVGELKWIVALVGLPWSAHGVVCSFYLNMAKSDHKGGVDGMGITYAAAQANGFKQDEDWQNSPPI